MLVNQARKAPLAEVKRTPHNTLTQFKTRKKASGQEQTIRPQNGGVRSRERAGVLSHTNGNPLKRGGTFNTLHLKGFGSQKCRMGVKLQNTGLLVQVAATKGQGGGELKAS